MKSSGPSELGVVMRPGGFIRRPTKPKVEEVTAGLVPTSLTSSSTKIFVHGLKVEAECGVYTFEKGHTRPLIMDIEIGVTSPASQTRDDLTQTVDYDTLVGHVQSVVKSRHFNLIETLAHDICTLILDDPRILSVRLRIEKPGAIPSANCAGVELVYTR